MLTPSKRRWNAALKGGEKRKTAAASSLSVPIACRHSGRAAARVGSAMARAARESKTGLANEP